MVSGRKKAGVILAPSHRHGHFSRPHSREGGGSDALSQHRSTRALLLSCTSPWKRHTASRCSCEDERWAVSSSRSGWSTTLAEAAPSPRERCAALRVQPPLGPQAEEPSRAREGFGRRARPRSSIPALEQAKRSLQPPRSTLWCRCCCWSRVSLEPCSPAPDLSGLLSRCHHNQSLFQALCQAANLAGGASEHQP